MLFDYPGTFLQGLFFYDMIRETNEPMISSTTPYKLAEIIRDTWYNLYTPTKYNQIHKELKLREEPNDEQV